MKPFKFTLQALYTLRQRQENSALEGYAASLMERTRAAESVAAAERGLAAARAAFQQEVSTGCLAAHLAHSASHCERLAMLRNERLQFLGEAERRVNAALKEMLAARQKREGVEQLLAKQRRAYQAAVERAEQKFLDELAQRRPESTLAANLESMPL